MVDNKRRGEKPRRNKTRDKRIPLCAVENTSKSVLIGLHSLSFEKDNEGKEDAEKSERERGKKWYNPR